MARGGHLNTHTNAPTHIHHHHHHLREIRSFFWQNCSASKALSSTLCLGGMVPCCIIANTRRRRLPLKGPTQAMRLRHNDRVVCGRCEDHARITGSNRKSSSRKCFDTKADVSSHSTWWKMVEGWRPTIQIQYDSMFIGILWLQARSWTMLVDVFHPVFLIHHSDISFWPLPRRGVAYVFLVATAPACYMLLHIGFVWNRGAHLMITDHIWSLRIFPYFPNKKWPSEAISIPFSSELHLWSNLPKGGGNGLGIHGMGTSKGQKGKLQRKGENMTGLAKKLLAWQGHPLMIVIYCLLLSSSEICSGYVNPTIPIDIINQKWSAMLQDT